MARLPLGGFAEPEELPPVAKTNPLTGEVTFTSTNSYVRPLGSAAPRAQLPGSPIRSDTKKPKTKAEIEAEAKAAKFKSVAGGVAEGFAAASTILPTTDALEAAVQVGMSGAAGAASGAVVGGPVGAIAGGLVGLAAGGVNAWLGTRAARRANRETKKRETEILARQEAREKQARVDALEQQGYNRKTAAIQSTWAAQELAKNKLYELLELDQNAQSFFLQQGL